MGLRGNQCGPGGGREQGHAPGQVAPDRPGADAHRLGGLHVGQAHLLVERDGLPLADRKGAQSGGPGFPVQVSRRRQSWHPAHSPQLVA